MGGKPRKYRKRCTHCRQFHSRKEYPHFFGFPDLSLVSDKDLEAFDLFIGDRCLNRDLMSELALAFAAGTAFGRAVPSATKN